MNTKILMTLSAIVLGILGALLTFLPMEILDFLHLTRTRPFSLLLQILGALYFAFGMLNWMAKSSLIGGIYNRPIAMANFSHFLIGSLALIKAIISTPNLSLIFLILAILYSLFGLIFGILLFRHPG